MRLALSVISALLYTTLAQVQHPNIRMPPSSAADIAAVKQLFNSTYGAYRKFAFGHDDVSPLSQSYSDSRNGWGATIVDSMGMMHMMGFDSWFEEAVQHVSGVDFSRSYTSDTVSVFESSTRYLGGLLSAYELSQKKHPILLQKAQELGDKLTFAWVGDNVIPFGFVDFSTNTPTKATSNIAEAAGMLLEFDRLSSLSGNGTYSKLARESVMRIMRLPSPLPGLPAQGIDPATGQSFSGYVTFGGGSDTYFYNILRLAMLPGPDAQVSGGFWKTAVDSAIRTLLKVSTVGEWLYLADYDDKQRIRHVSSHLECFAGGDWIVGGRLFGNVTITDYGLQLTDTCWNTYASTKTGLGPEVFAFISSDGGYNGGNPPTADQQAFYNTHGFYITAPDYVLRPEVLQSNLYAWRITGDSKYYDRALATMTSVNKYLVQKNGGVAGLNDVDDENASRIDDTESFFFAGLLKYLYLTFDDPNNFNLDRYILSSEGHLFPR